VLSLYGKDVDDSVCIGVTDDVLDMIDVGKLPTVGSLDGLDVSEIDCYYEQQSDEQKEVIRNELACLTDALTMQIQQAKVSMVQRRDIPSEGVQCRALADTGTTHNIVMHKDLVSYARDIEPSDITLRGVGNVPVPVSVTGNLTFRIDGKDECGNPHSYYRTKRFLFCETDRDVERDDVVLLDKESLLPARGNRIIHFDEDSIILEPEPGEKKLVIATGSFPSFAITIVTREEMEQARAHLAKRVGKKKIEKKKKKEKNEKRVRFDDIALATRRKNNRKSQDRRSMRRQRGEYCESSECSEDELRDSVERRGVGDGREGYYLNP